MTTSEFRPPVTYEDNVRDLISQMKSASVIQEGLFTSLGMLIVDSYRNTVVNQDHDAVRALHAAHDGLRWMYGHHPNKDHQGRFLGLIDVTYWALRRQPG